LNIPQIPLLAEFNTSYIIAAHKQANTGKLASCPFVISYRYTMILEYGMGTLQHHLLKESETKRELDRARLLKAKWIQCTTSIAPGYDSEDMVVAVIQITCARVRHIGQSLNNRLDQRGQKVGF